METFNWEEERKRSNKKAIEQHERLHRLFNENRFAFEMERKKMLNEIIESAPTEAQKEKLRTIQESWDNKMKKAGSKYNRLALAQLLFWDHVENIWEPFIQKCGKELRTLVGQKI
jgi:hypothetical protein